MKLRAAGSLRFVMLAAFVSMGGIAPGEWRDLEYAPAPASNPLKGFVPYVGEYDFPHSMEYTYVGFADLMESPGVFLFDETLEPILNRVADRGHQLVFRIYIDYPDDSFSLPRQYIDSGIELHEYVNHGGGTSPDYDFPPLVEGMETLITALGERYDGDPRIAFIQVGLLGHWGEWHTWPNDAWFPNVETQTRVLRAFDKAFDRTHLMVSQDSLGQEPMAPFHDLSIGFHDDGFPEVTEGKAEWKYLRRIERLGLGDRWRTLPIGGELLPNLQKKAFRKNPRLPHPFIETARSAHISWLLNHHPFVGDLDEETRTRTIEGARSLGYELFVSAVAVESTPEKTDLRVRVENRGIAPFYYDWPIRLGRVSDGKLISSVETEWRLTEVLPGTPVEWNVALDGVPNGGSLVLWVENPIGAARLKFANMDQTDEWLLLFSPAPGGR